MNKLFFVVLAICLVYVHAFVKRDAPATAPNALDDIMNTLKKFKEETEAKVNEALSPERVKEAMQSIADNANKIIAALNPSTETPK